jgi:hypothetical protein
MVIYGPEHVPYDIDVGPVLLVSSIFHPNRNLKLLITR